MRRVCGDGWGVRLDSGCGMVAVLRDWYLNKLFRGMALKAQMRMPDSISLPCGNLGMRYDRSSDGSGLFFCGQLSSLLCFTNFDLANRQFLNASYNILYQ